METLQRLADALGVELTELLDGVPSADARRAVLRRLCIAGAVTLILAGLWAYLHAVCLRQYQRGGMAPLAAMLITEPLLLCALAWTLLQALRRRLPAVVLHFVAQQHVDRRVEQVRQLHDDRQLRL